MYFLESRHIKKGDHESRKYPSPPPHNAALGDTGKKDKNKKSLRKPEVVIDNNKHMGSVDFQVDKQGLSCINAYIVYKKVWASNGENIMNIYIITGHTQIKFNAFIRSSNARNKYLNTGNAA